MHPVKHILYSCFCISIIVFLPALLFSYQHYCFRVLVVFSYPTTYDTHMNVTPTHHDWPQCVQHMPINPVQVWLVMMPSNSQLAQEDGILACDSNGRRQHHAMHLIDLLGYFLPLYWTISGVEPCDKLGHVSHACISSIIQLCVGLL